MIAIPGKTKATYPELSPMKMAISMVNQEDDGSPPEFQLFRQ